jgi:hypothetical protein
MEHQETVDPLTGHEYSTCRDDHEPGPRCRLAALDVLERKRLEIIRKFGEDIGVYATPHLIGGDR